MITLPTERAPSSMRLASRISGPVLTSSRQTRSFRAALSTAGASRVRNPLALGAIDADFSHDPKVVPKRWFGLSRAGEYGLAVGSRYVKGGGIENWPLKRKVTSLVACMLAWPLTSIRDITSGFILVKREALDGVELDPIGFKIGLEVAAKAHYGKALEVPYVFTDRVVGESKLNGKEIANYLRQLRRIYVARFLGHGAERTATPTIGAVVTEKNTA